MSPVKFFISEKHLPCYVDLMLLRKVVTSQKQPLNLIKYKITWIFYLYEFYLIAIGRETWKAWRNINKMHFIIISSSEAVTLDKTST